MVEHVTQWLGAYLDGELNGAMQRKVEAHLLECSACQGELKELKSLSELLKTNAAENRLDPGPHFASQVILKLPRQPAQPLAGQAARIGWWLVPAGILGGWVFLQTVLLVSSLALAAGQIVPWSGPLAWLSDLGGQNLVISAISTLVDGRFGLATNSILNFISEGASLSWDLVLPIAFQTALALMFISWLAVWWVGHFSKRS